VWGQPPRLSVERSSTRFERCFAKRGRAALQRRIKIGLHQKANSARAIHPSREAAACESPGRKSRVRVKLLHESRRDATLQRRP